MEIAHSKSLRGLHQYCKPVLVCSKKCNGRAISYHVIPIDFFAILGRSSTRRWSAIRHRSLVNLVATAIAVVVALAGVACCWISLSVPPTFHTFRCTWLSHSSSSRGLFELLSHFVRCLAVPQRYCWLWPQGCSCLA